MASDIRGRKVGQQLIISAPVLMRKRPDPSVVKQVERMNLLHDEVDRIREAAGERARGVDTKASFLVVAAGVVAPATLMERAGVPAVLVALPLVFVLISIVLATVALWPRKRLDLGAQHLFDLFYDSEDSRIRMEVRILKMKVQASNKRESRTRMLAVFTSAGFVSLTLAVALLGAAVVTSN